VPRDADAARDLALRDKHEFQKWIVATIGGQPYKGGKKGMDRGIDGYLHSVTLTTSRRWGSFRSRAAEPILPMSAISRARWSARARRSESSSR